MEKFIADKVTDWCVRQSKVSTIQEAAIRYGIELFLDSLLKIVFLLCIGAIFGKFKETAIAIGCFCLLRGEAGGVHMQTSLGCFLSMLTMTVLSVAGAELLPELSAVVTIPPFIIALITVYLFAPSATQNNPITDPQIRKRKKLKAMTVVVILMVIACTVPERPRALILIPVIIEIITIFPIWTRKEVKTNEGKLAE